MALTQSFQDQKPGFFFRLFDDLSHGLGRIAETNWRIRETERLSALSDEALAAKGIRREDIVRHVFQDVYWM
ncbi:MAG: DUF1127 domain-containing protein [Paracoccaceae bacterium]|jgi:hypothetical protein|nr:DUF1127 domain-containing protein [Paracoccaceae bacterium]